MGFYLMDELGQQIAGSPTSAGELAHSAFFSPAEFSRQSGLSPATVARYLARGKLPYLQPGGKRCRVLIPQVAFEMVARNNSTHKTDSSPADCQSQQVDHDSRLSGAKPKWMR